MAPSIASEPKQHKNCLELHRTNQLYMGKTHLQRRSHKVQKPLCPSQPGFWPALQQARSTAACCIHLESHPAIRHPPSRNPKLRWILTSKLIDLFFYSLPNDRVTIPNACDGGATDRIDNLSSVLERYIYPAPADCDRRLPRCAMQNRGGARRLFIGRSRGPVTIGIGYGRHGAAQGLRWLVLRGTGEIGGTDVMRLTPNEPKCGGAYFCKRV
jgi:hypothetical protein